MNSETSGPPGHHFVAVASRMSIPQSLNVEQVAIILMKAKKALQQLQFQWVVLNRPASGVGFVMFWNGGDLPDDGYCWMNRGRTDTLPTHQKSISIEATRFFDGYCLGDKHVSMTKTFYRFAGQQTSLYFVHYMLHPPDAPKKPIGPPIPTIKPQSKQPQTDAVAASRPPPGRSKGRASPVSPIQLPPNITSPQSRLPPPLSPPSKTTTIRLSMNQPKPPTKISPKRGRRSSEQQQQQQQQVEDFASVFCDFDTWGPVDHSLNQLLRTDAFLTKLFSVTTGLPDDQARADWDHRIQKESSEQLIASLKDQLSRSQADLAWLEQQGERDRHRNDEFRELEQVDTPEQLAQLADRHGLCLQHRQ